VLNHLKRPRVEDLRATRPSHAAVPEDVLLQGPIGAAAIDMSASFAETRASNTLNYPRNTNPPVPRHSGHMLAPI
jgi:hypothetical protein